jgi:hypothetical protein
LKYQLEYSVITNRNHTEEGIRQGVLPMKMHALLITSGLLFAITGAAKADDHLFEATQHGLTETSTGFMDLSTATTRLARAVHSRAQTEGHPRSTPTPASPTR